MYSLSIVPRWSVARSARKWTYLNASAYLRSNDKDRLGKSSREKTDCFYRSHHFIWLMNLNGMTSRRKSNALSTLSSARASACRRSCWCNCWYTRDIGCDGCAPTTVPDGHWFWLRSFIGLNSPNSIKDEGGWEQLPWLVSYRRGYSSDGFDLQMIQKNQKDRYFIQLDPFFNQSKEKFDCQWCEQLP